MRHGRHLVGGHLAHPGHGVQYHRELAAEAVQLGIGGLDPGQAGQVRDVVATEGGHGPESRGGRERPRSVAAPGLPTDPTQPTDRPADAPAADAPAADAPAADAPAADAPAADAPAADGPAADGPAADPPPPA